SIPQKSIARCVTNWLISSRNFDREVGGGFHRTDPSGSSRAVIGESQTRSAVIRCRFRRSVIRDVSSTVARIAGALSLAYAKSNEQSLVWPVAACITAGSSMYVFG